MQYAQLERLAYHHANPDTLAELLSHRAPTFDSGRQFGAFCGIVQSYDQAQAAIVSPTALILDMLELGCMPDATPRPWTPSPIPHHEEWIRRVHHAAENAAGRRAVRAWIASDVTGLSGRAVASALGVSRSTAAGLVDVGRAAIEDALACAGYLNQ